MSWVQEKSGSFWLFTLLIAATLVLLITLTWQSIQAARSNARIAESVLLDYAGTANEQYTRYLEQYFGTWWSMQFRRELIAHYTAPDYEPTRPFRLSPDAPVILFAARKATAAVFRIDWTFESVRAVEGVLPIPAASLLSAARSESEAPNFFVRHLESGDSSWWPVVFYPVEDKDHWWGVIYDPDSVKFRLSELARDYPLLPRAIAGPLENNQGIYVSVRSPGGEILFETETESRVDWKTDHASVEHRIEGDYRGLFSDFIVTVAIDPDLAEQLIIGGLPRGRLPLLMTLLALTVAVLTALVWVTLKERAVARMRSDFVARVSHEFRTPLTQIRMFTETVLLGRSRTEEQRTHYLQIVNREAKRLGHLVANVLTLSGRERRGGLVDVRPTDICAQLVDIVDEYRSMLPDSATRLRLSGCEKYASEPILAQVDTEAFTQIIINLLDNACKYGPDDQQVQILFEADQHCCRVCVDDEGPGVPDAEKERIWQLYYRMDRERFRAIGGTGIGLPIARELIECMGGQCHVEDAPRGGARFVAILRRAYQ